MTRQSSAFLNIEGDRWFERNKDKLPPPSDPVMACIDGLGIRPKKVAEFGCANGWRLASLQTHFGCECVGYDPSLEAILDGLVRYKNDHIQLIQGTAESRLQHNCYDLIIFGFCLYLCDRDGLFQIAANVDRALRLGGHIIIHDFAVPTPHSVPYHHKPGLLSYKMDYSKMFTWNPAYWEMVRLDSGDQVSVIVLKKSLENAWKSPQ